MRIGCCEQGRQQSFGFLATTLTGFGVTEMRSTRGAHRTATDQLGGSGSQPSTANANAGRPLAFTALRSLWRVAVPAQRAFACGALRAHEHTGIAGPAVLCALVNAYRHSHVTAALVTVAQALPVNSHVGPPALVHAHASRANSLRERRHHEAYSASPEAPQCDAISPGSAQQARD